MNQTKIDFWQGADQCGECHGAGFKSLGGNSSIVCPVCHGNGHKTHTSKTKTDTSSYDGLALKQKPFKGSGY